MCYRQTNTSLSEEMNAMSAKMNGTQRRTLKNVLYVLQGTSRAEATSNSEKIKPVALAPLSSYTCHQSVSPSVTQSVTRKIR